MAGNLSGLVELALVVGLLGWFWYSQRAATRKDEGPADTTASAPPRNPQGPAH